MTVVGGRYTLQAEIGRGGLGSVWHAADGVTGRDVAIKRLRSEYMADPRLRRRIRREARAVGRLEHPNIVRLFELGEDEQGPYLVMEWVRGRPLSRLGPVDGHRLVTLLEQVLAALAYAHARGVVHRDLKPENVLVTDGSDRQPERAKLLDFGFAWVEDDLDQEISLAARDVFGTPHYMAPEQAMREDTVGPAADLYAVGVIAWELCCGTLPFTGSTGAEVLIRHVSEPLPPFTPRPGLVLPAGIVDWLRRALAKEPGDRFLSAGEMRRTLLALESGVAATVDHLELADGNEATIAESLDGTLTPPQAPRLLAATDGHLVGREALMRWLWDHVVATFHQPTTAPVIMLEGDPGLGRTRLCSWLTRAVAEGGWMTVASSRHQQGVQSGLRAALRSAVGLDRRPPLRLEVVAHALAAAGAGDLDVGLVARCLWPELGTCPPSRARRVVERLVRRLAMRRPVLVCLDDLHRAWGEDLDLVEHLLVALAQRPAPVLLLMTRPGLPVMGQPTAGEARVAAFLKRRQELVEVRRVGRLSNDDTLALIRHALPVDDEVAQHIGRVARGNPLVALAGLTLLLEQRAVAPDATTGVHHFAAIPPALPPQPLALMAERLEVALGRHRDGALLRTLALHLALLGDAFPFSLAQALADALQLPEGRLVNALDTLVRLAVLEDRAGDVFAFRNAITRDALLQLAAAAPEPGALHAPVAVAKAAWYGDRAGLAAAEIARHHLAAEDVEKAVCFQVIAADHARRSQQHKVAVALLAEADRWLSTEAAPGTGALRADVLLRLAEVVLGQGDSARALRIAERVAEWAAARADRERAQLASRLRGDALAAQGSLAEAEAVLEPLGREAADEGRAAEATRIALIRGRIAVRRGDLRLAQQLFQYATDTAAATGHREGEAAGHQALGELALKLGDRDRALDALRLAAEIGRESEDEALRAAVHLRLGELERKSGRLEEALPHFRQAAEAFEAANNHSGVGRSLRGLGDAQWALGQPEAARTYSAAIDTFTQLEDAFQLGICLTQLGRIALENGDAATAEVTFERAAGHLEPFGDPPRLGLLSAFRAQAAHRRGLAGPRDLHLRAALQIDAHHPLQFAEWATALDELAGDQPGPAADALRARAEAVRAAVSTGDERSTPR